MLMIIAYFSAAGLLISLGMFIYRLGLKEGAALSVRLRRTAPPEGEPCSAYRKDYQASPFGGGGRRKAPDGEGKEAPEIARLNTIMQNIDNYDGSAKGQQGVV